MIRERAKLRGAKAKLGAEVCFEPQFLCTLRTKIKATGDFQARPGSLFKKLCLVGESLEVGFSPKDWVFAIL